MKQIALGIAVLIAIVYLGLCAAIFAFQRSLIYMPPPASADAGPQLVIVPADGVRVLVTVRHPERSRAVLYFGGNAEDVDWSLPALEAAFPDHALYLLHYRGYNGSTGKPSERALVSDALALFDKVAKQHAGMTVIGRSLGSGVALQLASQRPVAQLVLVTPYDSIEKLAAGLFPYLPVGWLLQDKYESWKYASRIAAPTLLIAAGDDEVIPRVRTEALLRSFRRGVAKLRIVPAAGHNTISERPEYLALLQGKL